MTAANVGSEPLFLEGDETTVEANMLWIGLAAVASLDSERKTSTLDASGLAETRTLATNESPTPDAARSTETDVIDGAFKIDETGLCGLVTFDGACAATATLVAALIASESADMGASFVVADPEGRKAQDPALEPFLVAPDDARDFGVDISPHHQPVDAEVVLNDPELLRRLRPDWAV